MTHFSYDALGQGIERALGYSGQDRFVLFYYDPQSQQVIWRDGRSYGSADGQPSSVFGELEARARACGVSVGDDRGPGDHALLVDRIGRRASFAYREVAQEFLARRLASAAN